MLLSKLLNYGLRIVIYLAMAGSVRSSHEVSAAVNVPRDYLVQIAQLLKHAGIIRAKAGKNGGYELAKDPGDITLLEVMNALEKSTGATPSAAQGEDQGATPDLLRILKALHTTATMHDEYLNSITVQMIADGTHDIDGLNKDLESLID